jgi:hypothetical protein
MAVNIALAYHVELYPLDNTLHFETMIDNTLEQKYSGCSRHIQTRILAFSMEKQNFNGGVLSKFLDDTPFGTGTLIYTHALNTFQIKTAFSNKAQ